VRIIPVIDLMGGQVVRGVAGRREEYRALASQLCATAAPLDVGRALAEWPFTEVYVADLDAILGAEPAWGIHETLAGCGLGLWVDAGLADVDAARRMAEAMPAGRPLGAVIAGLETLPDPGALEAMLAIVGQERLVFSLDLRGGEPLADGNGWPNGDPVDIADAALAAGVRRFIVLDLARVGMDGGVGTEALCRGLRERDAGLEIIAGGGVRGLGDLRTLATAGCDGALVASALHDGRITPDDARALALD